MNYVTKIDLAALASSTSNERITQIVADAETGIKACTINCIRTPAGGGSPAGLHTHVVDQVFYILSGIMSIEIDGKQYDVGPGTMVSFPAGVPHRNWNAGTEPTVHLAINTPAPDPNVPFAQTLGS